MRSATKRWNLFLGQYKFQSTHSLRSATEAIRHLGLKDEVSIHALLAECDVKFLHTGARASGFNPRTPCGVRHLPSLYSTYCREFQSTHSLRSATPGFQDALSPATVSIHALLAECDKKYRTRPRPSGGFNPRTPCGVRLSTAEVLKLASHVSIHALLAECDLRCWACQSRLVVSIHALLAECDLPRTTEEALKSWFQSTHSLRSATPRLPRRCSIRQVSIHALLAECDYVLRVRPSPIYRFNPRTPCGVRPFNGNGSESDVMFQSTHSLRSATVPTRQRLVPRRVSIHALLAECDCWSSGTVRPAGCFNPRTPCGVRPPCWSACSLVWPGVSIHALLAECDTTTRTTKANILTFQSTHSLRSATFFVHWSS